MPPTPPMHTRAPHPSAVAHRLHQLGCSVIPYWRAKSTGACCCRRGSDCHSPGKHPVGKWKRYQTERATTQQLNEWFSRGTHNVGIVTGAVSDLVVVDCDNDTAIAWADANLPPTPIRTCTSRGEHRYYRHPGTRVRNRVKIRSDDGLLELDVRGDGGGIVAPGSVHPSGCLYREVEPWTLEAWAAMPPFDPAWISEQQPELPAPPPVDLPALPQGTVLRRASHYLQKMEPSVQGEDGSGKLWRAATHMAQGFVLDSPTVRQLLDQDFNPRCDPIWSDTELEHVVGRAAVALPPGGKPRGWLVSGAKATAPSNGTGHPGHAKPAKPAKVEFQLPTGPAFDASGGLGLTDTHNADRLVCLHGKDILYCHPHKRWYVWDKKRWRKDDDGEIERRAKDAIQKIYVEATVARLREPDEKKGRELEEVLRKFAKRSMRARGVQDALGLARSAVPVRPTAFDADAWVVSCANGTIDLRTGELRPHRREDRITRTTPVAYDPEARAPRWQAFLREVFADDGDLIAYLQRVVGYCLTGDTREQALWILYGTGANGKSTLLDVLRAILGDYASHADISTFLRREQDTTRNDLAALQGARLVTAAEIEAGRRVDEALVKSITGGEPIRCRFLYGEYFEFQPQFKILIAANHKPVVRGRDAGIWRRLHLVPFEQSFEGRGDPDLLAKLRAELPGILAWAVEGCRAWQEIGLQPPSAVLGATTEYRAEMDVLAGFFSERCAFVDGARTTSKDLYGAYKEWCSDAGERPWSQRKFGMALRERGLTKTHGRRGKSWLGVGLRSCEVDSDNDESVTLGDPYDVKGHTQGSRVNQRQIIQLQQRDPCDPWSPVTSIGKRVDGDPCEPSVEDHCRSGGGAIGRKVGTTSQGSQGSQPTSSQHPSTDVPDIPYQAGGAP